MVSTKDSHWEQEEGMFTHLIVCSDTWTGYEVPRLMKIQASGSSLGACIASDLFSFHMVMWEDLLVSHL